MNKDAFKISLPQNYFNRIWRAIIEFDLIQANDNILVGFSGGKDSIFLLLLLSLLKRFSPRPFTLAAFTLDPMFADFNPQPFINICQTLSVPYHYRSSNIKQIIDNDDTQSPCYSCAFFRHGSINRFAQENGFNKIAYAHHNDDVVETFLMNIFYSGYLKTFLPKTYLSRTNLAIIRPLIYFREHEIIAAQSKHQFSAIKNPCPYNGNTKRGETKLLLKNLEKTNPSVYKSLAASLRENAQNELWEKAPSRDDLKTAFLDFWKKNTVADN